MLNNPLEISPDWLPVHLQEPGTVLKLRLYKAERQILRRKAPMPVSIWAEQNRVLPQDSSVPGPWRNTTTPYMAGVMDGSFFPSVQQIILCWPPQTGKSDGVNNCIGYASDRAPGNVLYIYPDELTARENNRDRIQPMFQNSPRLRKLLSGYADDESALCLRLRHMKIYMGWANSASRLSNKPLPYVVLDEEDKYPTTTGKKEGAPVDLAKKRTRTFAHMRKVWRMSTPTVETGAIWVALQTEAEVVFVWWVQCPECGHDQQMEFKQIRWPGDERDPRVIESRRLAWYECTHCHARWDDAQRNQAVRLGEWRSRPSDAGENGDIPLMAYLEQFKPLSIGFHLRSYVSPFVSLSEVAAAFLWGLKDKTKHKDFCNAHEAEPWREYSSEKSENAILALRDERLAGQAPGGNVVAALVAGIDTQDDGFFYEIRAWGHGLVQDSWQIRSGFVTSLEALAQVLWSDEYRCPDRRYLVMTALIDAMGHRTAEVYDFCRLNPGKIFPTKGERTMRQPHVWSRIDNYPGTNKPIPGGLALLRVNTTHYKNALASMLEIPFADPGAWKYHSELTVDWAVQMTSEYIAEDGFWACKSGRANHAWDCSVLSLAAADLIGVRFWSERSGKTAPAKRPKNDRQEWLRREGGQWLNR
ncbi:MAG: terminase gpA endonuclease subunit [Marinobacterium sp.]